MYKHDNPNYSNEFHRQDILILPKNEWGKDLDIYGVLGVSSNLLNTFLLLNGPKHLFELIY